MGSRSPLSSRADAAAESVLTRLAVSLLREQVIDPDAAAAAGVCLTTRPKGRTGDLTLTAVTVDGVAVERPEDLLDALSDRGLLPAPAPGLGRLRAEVSDGVRGLERARRGLARRWADRIDGVRPGFTDLLGLLDRGRPEHRRRPHWLLSRFEQLVGEGHHQHPCAKTALGLTERAAARFLPEQSEAIPLRVVAVEKDLATCTPGGQEWSSALHDTLPAVVRAATEELVAGGLDPATWTLIPVHPFQAEVVLPEAYPSQLELGQIRLLSASTVAEPLMSVRTLATDEGDGGHVKTAVEVQLTGAIRGISPHAASTGPRMSAEVERILAVDAVLVGRTPDDLPTLEVAPDRASAHVPQPTDRPRVLGAILRGDPTARCAENDVPLPVAALLAPSPVTGNTILDELLAELPPGSRTAWLETLLELLLPPCLGLVSRWGVALEPHPQNTVLVLRDLVPLRVVIRDMGGTRILPERGRRRGLRIDPVAGSPLVADSADDLRAKTYFPLFGNLLAALIPALACGEEDEQSLWAVVSREVDRVMRDLYAARLDDGEGAQVYDDAQALLESPWRHKCMLHMRLTGAVTEQRYVEAPNPLRDPARETDLSAADTDLARRIAAERPGARADTTAALVRSARREGLLPESVADDEALTTLAETTAAGSDLLGESAESAENLALARAQVARRRERLARQAALRGTSDLLGTLVATLPASLASVTVDSMVADGHNVHPNAKVRRGFSVADSLRFAPDAGKVVDLRILAVESSLLRDSAVGGCDQRLRRAFPLLAEAADRELADAGRDPDRFRLIPVHPWQWVQVLEPALTRHGLRDRTQVLAVTLATVPTISTRTLLTRAPGALGVRLMVKVSLDVLLTSTRRSISPTTALASPLTARLVETLLGEQDTRVVPELAGSCLACPQGSDSVLERGLSCLLRGDPCPDRATAAISTCALRAPGLSEATLLAELIERRPEPERQCRALAWLRQHTDNLLRATVPLMWNHGIALEAHLQNTLVLAGADGAGDRLVLRDFGGLRYLPSRLQDSGHRLPDLEDSRLATDDAEVVRAKLGYALVWGHLDPLVEMVAEHGGLPPEEAWAVVRGALDRLVRECRPAGAAREDLRVLTAPELPRKAFARMRLAPRDGDQYRPARNPLRL